MATQGDLLRAAQPPVPGLLLADDAVSRAEEAELGAHIDAAPLEPFKFGQ